jgi:hypothetical protein
MDNPNDDGLGPLRGALTGVLIILITIVLALFLLKLIVVLAEWIF